MTTKKNRIKGGITLTHLTYYGIILSLRIKELQSYLSLVEQFDEALLKFSQWSETMLSNLHSVSQVNISNLQTATAHVKVRITQNWMLLFSEPLVQFAELNKLILYQLHLTGDPDGPTEAAWSKTALGAAN